MSIPNLDADYVLLTGSTRVRKGPWLNGIVAAALVASAGCSVGPDYHRPSAVQSQTLPATFTGSTSFTNTAAWKPASPSAQLPRGAWWEIFDDTNLNGLEAHATAENQSLAQAAAAFEQARALVQAARANYFPQISAAPSFTHQRTSINAPVDGRPAGAAYTYNTLAVPLELNWEIDLWGRVRRQTAAAHARFTAAADDLEAAKLEIQSETASDYFTLRALDAEHAIVADTIETFRRSLELTQNRRRGGVVSDLDVSEADTQLRNAQAQLPAIELRREQLQHALAALCGRPASDFQIAVTPATSNAIPAVPLSLPSELLERRPDIAAAERRMAAANNDIGVAVSAFYPQINFNGLAGVQSVNAGTLFNWPSRLWAIGPSVDLPIFTGGLNRAQLESA